LSEQYTPLDQVMERIGESALSECVYFISALRNGNCDGIVCPDCPIPRSVCNQITGRADLLGTFFNFDTYVKDKILTALKERIRKLRKEAEETASKARIKIQDRSDSALDACVDAILKSSSEQVERVMQYLSDNNCRGSSCSNCAMKPHLCEILLGNEKGKLFHYRDMPSGRDVRQALMCAAYARGQSVTRQSVPRGITPIREKATLSPSYDVRLSNKCRARNKITSAISKITIE
jgi:hypothetical protein